MWWDNTGDFEKAFEALDKASDIDWKHKDVWYHLGKTLEKLEKYDEALDAFDTDLRIDNKDIKSWTIKANILLKLERYKEAIEVYEEILKLDPNNTDAKQNKYVATKELKKQEHSVLIKSIESKYANKEYLDVIKLSNNAIDKEPTNHLLYLYKGNVLQELTRYEEALQCYDKALEIDPKNSDALNKRKIVKEVLNPLQKIYSNSYSVIIGISRYKEEVSLSNAYNDASKINNVLEKDYGFKNLVSPLFNENATKENIEKIFTDTIQNNERIGTNDRVLIYYAGHGKLRRILKYDGTETKEGFIKPYDSKKDIYFSNIPMEMIIKSCQNSNAKHVLLILDCCYNGEFAATRSNINDDYHQIDKKYLNDIASRRAIQVLAARQDDQPVSDSEIRPGHSAFTGALLDILENQADLNGDGIISVREIAHDLETQVVRHTRGIFQRPVYNEIVGSRNGDFLFKIPSEYSR